MMLDIQLLMQRTMEPNLNRVALGRIKLTESNTPYMYNEIMHAVITVPCRRDWKVQCVSYCNSGRHIAL